MERRNKKSGANKKTSLLKHEDGQNSKSSASKNTQVVAPRILLKAKEKDSEKKVEPTIIIATKAGNSRTDQQPQPNSDDPKPRSKIPHDVPAQVTIVSTMSESVSLMGNSNALNVHAFNFLQDNNNDFFVIGAVGGQFTGKSTILNLLAASSSKDNNEQVLCNGVFPVNDIFSRKVQKESDDEIRMFITTDRIILLDSAPVMSNRGKKDFILSELDDIRRIILLLNTCHVLVVMLDDYFNINFIRLLLCAEMMIQKDQKNIPYLCPTLVFVKNKCERKICLPQENALNETIYKQLFKGSKLRIFSCDADYEGGLNVVNFPNLKDESFLANDAERMACVQQLRQHIFMSPKYDANDSQDSLNEKKWSQLVTSALEEHNNNYFLRKYENLSEKYNLHNHINVAENAAKEKNYLSFIDT